MQAGGQGFDSLILHEPNRKVKAGFFERIKMRKGVIH